MLLHGTRKGDIGEKPDEAGVNKLSTGGFNLIGKVRDFHVGVRDLSLRLEENPRLALRARAQAIYKKGQRR